MAALYDQHTKRGLENHCPHNLWLRKLDNNCVVLLACVRLIASAKRYNTEHVLTSPVTGQEVKTGRIIWTRYVVYVLQLTCDGT